MKTIEKRKIDHLELFKDKRTNSKRSTLLECVQLRHIAMPELSIDDIDISVEFAGKQLKAPLMITAMTGGAQRAREFNLAFAEIAQEFGIAMGLGSQRAMIEHPELEKTFTVRNIAPDIFLAGNIGGAQITQYSNEQIAHLVHSVKADALCVHLNPAQELVQTEGDTNFIGIKKRLQELEDALDVPIIVKETGAGIGFETALQIVDAGIEYIDVSGVGGTSWVGVELLRANREDSQLKELWDWGIPTAEAVIGAHEAGAKVIASGGIRSGLDVAKSIALGADLAGFAAPIILAYYKNGKEGVANFISETINLLKTTMLLCGTKTIADLKSIKPTIGGELLERIRNLKSRGL